MITALPILVRPKAKVGDIISYSKTYWIITQVVPQFYREGDHAVRYENKKVGDEKPSIVNLKKIAREDASLMKTAVKTSIYETGIEAFVTPEFIADEIIRLQKYLDNLDILIKYKE